MSTAARYDVCVVGAGLVGLATARAIAEDLVGVSILLLDKEDQIAAHQSSHNSGVIHSGLYYKPGSLKARLCVEGRDAVYHLGETEGIPVERSGKLVIATDLDEIPALEELERRGRANGLGGLTRLDPDGIKEHEPAAAGIDALFVPEAGVADFPALATHLSGRLRAGGAEIRLGQEVTAIDHTVDGVEITAGDERFSARSLVNCAGLHSDRVAALAGVESTVKIIPFRGEYYRLSDEAESLVKTLIYPVPDPRFPFLGVHFTRRIDGGVEVGPNAVLALGREQYRGVGPVWPDLREVLASRGFRRLATRHWLSGTKELLSSRSRRLYARLARRLVPAVRPEHLIEGGAGVRAQAVNPDGSLVDDFVIERAGTSIHVLNAPSPGATASLAIGRHIAGQVEPLLAG
ncbi:MAG TPA: L-2-hydroxyglutarate oxidase [Acidimicrobiia bacterium]|nr:L-2-hydroxyglutarate oxidase [Acidimicrobiia bacterium]